MFALINVTLLHLTYMKNFKNVLGVVIVVLVVGLLYVFLVNPAEAPIRDRDEDMVACTMDAMQCPDGSYVGRSGPNCEFVCPE